MGGGKIAEGGNIQSRQVECGAVRMIQRVAIAKATDLARRGAAIQDFSNYAFQFSPQCRGK